MSFQDFIKEFFRYTSNQPGNYLDTTHIILASIVSAATIFLGVFLGLKFKDKDEATKTKLILPFAIVMWLFSLTHMTLVVIRTTALGGNGWRQLLQCDLPLFLCDIQYFALGFVCFGHGRLKKIACDFCICLGILTFAMGVWLNAGTYSGTPWWASTYIYEMVVHAIPGGIALYIMIARLSALKFKEIWLTLLVLLGFQLIALTLDYAVGGDTNYMFFIRDAGTPFFIFRNWAGENQVLYSFFVWCGMTVYVVLYYVIWELMRFIVIKIRHGKAA